MVLVAFEVYFINYVLLIFRWSFCLRMESGHWQLLVLVEVEMDTSPRQNSNLHHVQAATVSSFTTIPNWFQWKPIWFISTKSNVLQISQYWRMSITRRPKGPFAALWTRNKIVTDGHSVVTRQNNVVKTNSLQIKCQPCTPVICPELTQLVAVRVSRHGMGLLAGLPLALDRKLEKNAHLFLLLFRHEGVLT